PVLSTFDEQPPAKAESIVDFSNFNRPSLFVNFFALSHPLLIIFTASVRAAAQSAKWVTNKPQRKATRLKTVSFSLIICLTGDVPFSWTRSLHFGRALL